MGLGIYGMKLNTLNEILNIWNETLNIWNRSLNIWNGTKYISNETSKVAAILSNDKLLMHTEENTGNFLQYSSTNEEMHSLFKCWRPNSMKLTGLDVPAYQANIDRERNKHPTLQGAPITPHLQVMQNVLSKYYALVYQLLP